jgi:hypothetical protein
MKWVMSVFTSSLAGALVCAMLSSTIFLTATLRDGIRLSEALGYSLIVGFIAAFIGVFIGFVIGVGKLGLVGGGLVGVLVTAAVVAFYVLTNGRPGQYSYFLRQSITIIVVLALPTVLAGVMAAWVGSRVGRTLPAP